MRLRLGTGIEQEDVTFLQLVDESVVMEHLSLSGSNRREGQRIAMTTSHFFHSSSHLRFMNTWPYGPIGCQMHLRTQVDALFYQADLLLILIVTLGDDGLDERHGSLSRLSGRLHPEQFPEPHLVVTAIGRQEVDRLTLGTGFVDIVLQLLHGHRVADADL